MGIIRVQLINWTGGGHKYKKVYRVETDDPNFGPRAIENYFRDELGIRRGVAYEHSAGGTTETDVSSFAAYPVIEPFQANRTNWTVTWDYSDTEPPEEEEEEDNPLLQPADFSRFAQAREQVIERDIHGKAIRNSAEDRFDEVLTVDRHRTVLRAVKNFAKFPQSYYRYMNTVNRTPLRIDDEEYGPRQVRIINMSDSRKYSDVLVTEENARGMYFEGTLELAFAEDDWQLVLLDQGVRQKVRRWMIWYYENAAATTESRDVKEYQTEQELREFLAANYRFGVRYQEIASRYEAVREIPPPLTDKDGKPAAASGAATKLPMMLDGKGRQQVFNGVPVWLEYQGYFEADFSIFGLS
jgi:hypothetical protein